MRKRKQKEFARFQNGSTEESASNKNVLFFV